MKKYNYYLRKANKIIDRLTKNVKENPSCLCENYGQKEIHPLIDELNGLYSGLTYSEICKIKEVLYSVSNISL